MGKRLYSLQVGTDGKLAFHLSGALAEFERSPLPPAHERWAQSRQGGATMADARALTDHQLKMAVRMLAAPDVNVQQVAEHFGVARSTLYRLLERVPGEVVAKDRSG